MFQFSKGYREPVERPHIETPQFPGECDPDWPPLGKIYDKKPWKIELEAGKRYSWCSCGHSKNQVSQPARQKFMFILYHYFKPIFDRLMQKLYGTMHSRYNGISDTMDVCTEVLEKCYIENRQYLEN